MWFVENRKHTVHLLYHAVNNRIGA